MSRSPTLGAALPHISLPLRTSASRPPACSTRGRTARSAWLQGGSEGGRSRSVAWLSPAQPQVPQSLPPTAQELTRHSVRRRHGRHARLAVVHAHLAALESDGAAVRDLCPATVRRWGHGRIAGVLSPSPPEHDVRHGRDGRGQRQRPEALALDRVPVQPRVHAAHDDLCLGAHEADGQRAALDLRRHELAALQHGAVKGAGGGMEGARVRAVPPLARRQPSPP